MGSFLTSTNHSLVPDQLSFYLLLYISLSIIDSLAQYSNGQVSQLQKVIGTTAYTIGYQYNAANDVTQITYPSGRVVQYAFSSAGWLCEVAGSTTQCGSSSNSYASIPDSSAGFAPTGQVLGLNYGNGVVGTFLYSPNRSQLATLSYAKGSSTYFSLSYSYQQGSGCTGEPPEITAKFSVSKLQTNWKLLTVSVNVV